MDYGTVKHDGRTYTLTSNADYTGRQIPYRCNFNDAGAGEEFLVELAATATGEDGREYTVTWIISDIKGSEQDIGDYDYSKPVSVDAT